MDKVKKSMYIYPGTFLSLSHMFYIRKGLDDARMVYNDTSCSFKLAICEPHFGLPIFQHTLHALLIEY